MSRVQLSIGLANESLANTIWDELQHMTGASAALTIAPTTLTLGVTGGTMRFLGHTVGATRISLASNTGLTSVLTALQSYGLISIP